MDFDVSLTSFNCILLNESDNEGHLNRLERKKCHKKEGGVDLTYFDDDEQKGR